MDANTQARQLLDVDKMTFPEFVMRCALSLESVREYVEGDNFDNPLREVVFKPGHSISDALEGVRKNLAKVEAWSEKKAEKEARETYERVFSAFKEEIRHKKVVLRRCLAMHAKVNAWVPPTPGHDGLKALMLKALDEAIEAHPPRPKKMAGAEFKRKLITRLRQDIKTYSKAHEAEMENIRELTAWMRALRESLKV